MRKFKKYSNQDIYDLLSKKITEEELFKKQAGWLDKVLNFFKGGDQTNQTQSQEQPSQVPSLSALPTFNAYAIKDPTMRQALRVPLFKLSQWYLNLNKALQDLNKDPNNPTFKQNYFNVVNTLNTLKNSNPILNELPEAKAYMHTLLNTVHNDIGKFSNINASILSTPQNTSDPSSYEATLTDQMHRMGEEAKDAYTNKLSKPQTYDDQIANTKSQIASGKIDSEKGKSILKDLEYKKHLGPIDRLLFSAARYANDENRIKEINDKIVGMIDNLPEDISPELKAQFLDHVGATAVRIKGLSGLKDVVETYKFGDMGTNGLYKNDAKARANLIKNYKRFNPGASDSEIYEKIYGKSGTDAYNKALKADFGAYVNDNSNFRYGYDDRTGELLYGFGGYGKNPWNRIKVKQDLLQSLNKSDAHNNIRQNYDKLISAGIPDDIAKRLVVSNASVIRNKTFDGSYTKNPFVYNDAKFRNSTYNFLKNLPDQEGVEAQAKV